MAHASWSVNAPAGLPFRAGGRGRKAAVNLRGARSIDGPDGLCLYEAAPAARGKRRFNGEQRIREIPRMIPYPHIDPTLIRIGPIHVRWYGVMYVLGFLAAYVLIQRQTRSKSIGLQGNVAQDLVFYLAVGLVVGARLGYIVFYQFENLDHYLSRPLDIFATWLGGMSFHGGLLGCVIAGWLFCRRRRLPFWAVADSVTVTAPVGLGLGRLGNFINGELFGRPSDVPWAMIFPGGGPLARHPSQLYEAFFEGAVLFGILWGLRKRNFHDGFMVAAFLFLYGLFRFFLEFFREPDPHLGFVLGPLSMGQLLCVGMILAAVGLEAFLRRRAPTPKTPNAGQNVASSGSRGPIT